LPHYGVLLVAAFWTLCLAASPLYEFYWQVLIFAIVGLLEVKEMTPRLAAVPVALAQAPRAIEPARPGRAATRGEWRAAAGGGRRRGRG
jgi:hypothetical protein